MKAIVRDRYGPPESVLELREVEVPPIRDDEVLVEVRAASVNAGDAAIVKGSPYIIRPVYGMRRPRRLIIGQDLAGTVERVGAEVTRFSPGDEVFGGGFGAFAEYAAAPEKRLALKPASLDFVTAATAPIAGLTALQGDSGRRRYRSRSEGPHQRGLGRRWDLCDPDRQDAGSRGDCGLQHTQREPGSGYWSRSRHRLHQRGLHQGSSQI